MALCVRCAALSILVASAYRGPCGEGELLGFYKGAENAAVCCNASCGLCQSDSACGSRPGNCCPGRIRRRSRECGTAPCSIREKCQDWKPIDRWRAPYPVQRTLATSNSSSKTLIFIPIGRKKATIVADTCTKALATSLYELFLAHYDNSAGWYAANYPEWYPERIWRTVDYADFKAAYVLRELIRPKGLLATFSHVWVMDDDVRFPPLDSLLEFASQIQKLNPLIAQPAIRGTWQRLVGPESDCRVWTTDFVEVMAPIMRTPVFVDIYRKLFSVSAKSDWGMDTTWCNYAKRRFKTSDPVCLVISPAVGGVVSPFRKADRITARQDYFRFYTHSYSTAASLWDKRCMKHNLRPFWARFEGNCLERHKARNQSSR